jgi:HD-like signal output (HDOD) protein
MNFQAVTGLSSLSSQVARECLTESLARPQGIAPMPQVCAQLAELTAQQETDARQLVRVIQSDPVVVGEIMRIANSPALRPRSVIVSLQQAVAWLGLAEVRNITIATVLKGEVFSAPGHEPETEELWREAWLGGLWAKEIARLRRKHVESAFLAGLMHRAGAALALKILSQHEVDRRTAMDAHTFRDLVAEFEPAMARSLMSTWSISGEIQDAASQWRHYQTSAQGELAATVNAAHLLAEHTLHPQLIGEEIVLADGVFEFLGVFPDDRLGMLAKRDQIRQVAGF